MATAIQRIIHSYRILSWARIFCDKIVRYLFIVYREINNAKPFQRHKWLLEWDFWKGSEIEIFWRQTNAHFSRHSWLSLNFVTNSFFCWIPSQGHNSMWNVSKFLSNQWSIVVVHAPIYQIIDIVILVIEISTCHITSKLAKIHVHVTFKYQL